MISADEFKHGMRHLAAAVNIVSTLEDEQPRGLLATAVCSVSTEPPMLLACINRSARSYAAIKDSGHFCINVLAKDQLDLARSFLTHDAHKRFDIIEWCALKTGAPALESALINFDCEVVNSIKAGTHMIFVGRVVHTRCTNGGEPLLYFNGNYAGLSDVGEQALAG